MVQRRNGARFTIEPFAEVRIAGEVAGQYLDRDDP